MNQQRQTLNREKHLENLAALFESGLGKEAPSTKQDASN